MTCEPWQESISAIADGEDPGIDVRLLDAHVARCAACSSFRAFAEANHRRSVVRPAEPQPDLAPQVARWAAALDRASRWSAARAVLAVVAIEIIAFSLPALVLGDEQQTSQHAARHLGAFTVAYGVGLLAVVVRPARASTSPRFSVSCSSGCSPCRAAGAPARRAACASSPIHRGRRPATEREVPASTSC